jgi:hypothetical protein
MRVLQLVERPEIYAWLLDVGARLHLAGPRTRPTAPSGERGGRACYVPVSPSPNADVMRPLPSWIVHYNEVHPHTALGYLRPVSSLQLTRLTVSIVRGLHSNASSVEMG